MCKVYWILVENIKERQMKTIPVGYKTKIVWQHICCFVLLIKTAELAMRVSVIRVVVKSSFSRNACRTSFTEADVTSAATSFFTYIIVSFFIVQSSLYFGLIFINYLYCNYSTLLRLCYLLINGTNFNWIKQLVNKNALIVSPL